MFAEDQVRRIQDKCQQLVKQYNALQRENIKLKEELSERRLELDNARKQTELMSQQLEVLKLNAGSLNEKDKKELEKKINGYLKEIDKCISMLSE